MMVRLRFESTRIIVSATQNFRKPDTHSPERFQRCSRLFKLQASWPRASGIASLWINIVRASSFARAIRSIHALP